MKFLCVFYPQSSYLLWLERTQIIRKSDASGSEKELGKLFHEY